MIAFNMQVNPSIAVLECVLIKETPLLKQTMGFIWTITVLSTVKLSTNNI